MPTVTLLTTARNDFSLRQVDNFLESTLSGLNVKIEILGVASRGWVQVAVSGEDEKVALRYLADEIGICPADLEKVERFSMMRGQITDIDKSKDKLCIDVGIFSPEIVDTIVSLQNLQAQLVDGRKVALKKISDLFGFCENLPLTIKIYDVDKDNTRVEAMLSEEQLVQYKKWTKALIDRLIVLGATIQEIDLTLKRTDSYRDVVSVEPLGLFEHSIVCKLGTDAAGLIPRIGKKLPNTTLTVFSPKKIIEFLGEHMLNT